MIDYKDLKTICIRISRISGSVVDDFLINYAARREKLDREMNKRLSVFRHVIREFQPEWIAIFKSQYIAHKLFKRGGLIKKYLNHSSLKDLNTEEKNYLAHQAAHPWKFSYSVITGRPAEHFYIMKDVFTGDSYLLFSPGISEIIRMQPVQLWFNLIAFNGSCWQSFGPIGAYQSFEPEDILFYAEQLNPVKWIETGFDILADVEENPFPYIMLLSGSVLPQVFHKKDQIVYIVSDHVPDSFAPAALKPHFKAEYADGVYKFSLKKWGGHPHFSTVYYDEDEELMILTSMTDRGFVKLLNRLNGYGFEINPEPDYRVNPSMLTTAGKILKKEINLIGYDKLFTQRPDEGEQEGIDKLNRFIQIILPDINSGRKPDIETAARKSGVDIESARDLVQQLTKKLRGMK